MDYLESYRLTCFGILVAFLELGFAYCLLCVSAFLFVPSKLLVFLPHPCSRILKVVFDWPFTIILRVQKLATTSFHHEQEENILFDEDKTFDLVTKVRSLERALEEERAARAALITELEEERAASASAADEAMAMILRLQADKASLEMEGKQYERMIEEKFVYDEEEMNVLKEILFKREKEKHFLEKELETYKHIDYSDTEDREPIMYDVHVIEDGGNDPKMRDDDYDGVEQKDKEDHYKMKEIDDIVKDHDISPLPSSSSLYLS